MYMYVYIYISMYMLYKYMYTNMYGDWMEQRMEATMLSRAYGCTTDVWTYMRCMMSHAYAQESRLRGLLNGSQGLGL